MPELINLPGTQRAANANYAVHMMLTTLSSSYPDTTLNQTFLHFLERSLDQLSTHFEHVKLLPTCYLVRNLQQKMVPIEDMGFEALCTQWSAFRARMFTVTKLYLDDLLTDNHYDPSSAARMLKPSFVKLCECFRRIYGTESKWCKNGFLPTDFEEIGEVMADTDLRLRFHEGLFSLRSGPVGTLQPAARWGRRALGCVGPASSAQSAVGKSPGLSSSGSGRSVSRTGRSGGCGELQGVW